MFKNYIKIAWKVLLKKKLYTFSSLVGISLTLTVIIIGSSFYDFILKPNYPAYKQNNILLLNKVKLWGKTPNNNVSIWSAGYQLVDKYVKTLTTAEKVTVYTKNPTEVALYLDNGKKLDLHVKYTDGEFWDILDFKFLDGRPYNKTEVQQADNLVVINETLSRNIFGTTKNVAGKYLEIDKKNYRIAGVVKDVPSVRFNTYGNVWAPVTTSKMDLKSKQLTGPFSAMILSKSRKNFKAIQDEFQKNLTEVEFPNPDYQWNIKSSLYPFKESVIKAAYIIPETGWFGFQVFVFIVLFLFILLPLLNILNINSNRLFERFSEIGIRKSFGASKRIITGQFLFENIIITLFSGGFAYVLAFILLKLIQHSYLIPDGDLYINLRTFFTSFLIMIVFGILSGAWPAYRFSRKQIVNALNHKEL